MKNVIKNKTFWFPKKLYNTRKKCRGPNCSFHEDVQIYLRPVLDRARIFRSVRKKHYQK